MKYINSLIMPLASLILLISCSGEPGTVAGSQNNTTPKGMAPAWTLEDVPVAPAVAMANRYPSVETRFPGGVRGLPDLVYSQIPGYRPLRLDLYLPPDTGSVHPMVIYIHGGGWQNGHSRQSGAFEDWPATLAMIASRGYVVTSINYRLGGEEPFPAAIQDVKTALRWLRAHAGEYGIDKEKFLVWGASAGGHLAALAGTSCGVAPLEPVNLPEELAAESDCVQATIGWYGIYDLTGMGQGGGPGGYFAGQLKEASPASYVDESDGAFLLIHGEKDPVIDYQQAIDFNDLLKSHKLQSSVHILPGVAHSYIGESADSTRAASIRALELSLEFMDEVLR